MKLYVESMCHSTNPESVQRVLRHAKHGPLRDELQGICQDVEHMDRYRCSEFLIVVVQHNNPHFMLENL